MKNELKIILRVLTRQLRVRIRSGPCQGLLWSLTTRSRFVRGVYEQSLAALIAASLQPRDIFWDLGAHFGYYTLVASRAVSSGHCHAFEPNPQNLWYLRHHLQWNGIGNATTHSIALAREDGTRRFGGGCGSGSGRLDRGSLIVQTRSMNSLVRTGTCAAPTFVKMDVQGAEAEILAGASSVLKEQAPTFCISTHGAELHAQCRRILASYGSSLHDFPAEYLLIAVGAGREISDRTLRSLGPKISLESV